MVDHKPNDAPPAVENAFEVAFWFFDAALNSNEYLQPQKLHRLLYLAQAYFAVAYAGRKLMPAIFVAEEMGPIEPNLYAAFSQGRPAMDVIGRLAPPVEMFLDGVWRRFGSHSADYLTKLTKDTRAYLEARDRGRRGVISLEAMRGDFERPRFSPEVGQVMRPRVMRSQSGKPVSVSAWLPGVKQAEREEGAATPPEPEGGGKVVRPAWPSVKKKP